MSNYFTRCFSRNKKTLDDQSVDFQYTSYQYWHHIPKMWWRKEGGLKGINEQPRVTQLLPINYSQNKQVEYQLSNEQQLAQQDESQLQGVLYQKHRKETQALILLHIQNRNIHNYQAVEVSLFLSQHHSSLTSCPPR